MSRLIDAYALLNTAERARTRFDVIIAITDAPTIDAEPVRHGRWVYDDEITELQGCSACGEFDKRMAEPPIRCPKCNAKMDLEEGEVL